MYIYLKKCFILNFLLRRGEVGPCGREGGGCRHSAAALAGAGSCSVSLLSDTSLTIICILPFVLNVLSDWTTRCIEHSVGLMPSSQNQAQKYNNSSEIRTLSRVCVLLFITTGHLPSHKERRGAQLGHRELLPAGPGRHSPPPPALPRRPPRTDHVRALL